MKLPKNYYYIFKRALNNVKKGLEYIQNNVDKTDIEKQIIYLVGKRFISHSKAIIVLCKKNYKVEALMVLRALIELTVNLRWILEKGNIDSFLKNTEYDFENELPVMGKAWANKSLYDRMVDIGFKEDYYKCVLKKLHEELHGNPAVIARAHHKELTNMSTNGIYSICCQMIGHLLKILNTNIPEFNFINPTDIWSQITFHETNPKKRIE